MAYLGEEIKKLGFGLMRLPQKDGAIDIEQTKKVRRLKNYAYISSIIVLLQTLLLIAK